MNTELKLKLKSTQLNSTQIQTQTQLSWIVHEFELNINYQLEWGLEFYRSMNFRFSYSIWNAMKYSWIQCNAMWCNTKIPLEFPNSISVCLCCSLRMWISINNISHRFLAIASWIISIGVLLWLFSYNTNHLNK